jgi:hypothetical protein
MKILSFILKMLGLGAVVALMAPLLFLLILLGISLFNSVDMHLNIDKKLAAVLPAEVQFERVLDWGDDVGIFYGMLGFFLPSLDAKGVVIFELQDDFTKSLSTKGIVFLQGASHAKFSEWRLTPVPERTDNKLPQTYGLDRAQGIDADLKEKMWKAISTPGSFYAEGDIDIIVLSPQFGIGAYIFADP